MKRRCNTAVSRVIIENSDQLSDSSLINASASNFPGILDLTLDGEIMTESDNSYLPNIIKPIIIDINNHKGNMLQNFYFYSIGLKLAVTLPRQYEANKQK